MAANHTAKYKLNQWESTDKVERLDFNADNAAVEAALTGHDEQIAAVNTRLSVAESDLNGAVEQLREDMESEVAAARGDANTKIAALETSSNSQITSVQSTLNTKIKSLQTSLNTTNTNVSKCYSPTNKSFKTGTYVGNSAQKSNNSNTQSINIGFTPSFVLVYARAQTPAFAVASGAYSHTWNDSYVNLEIITNGFRVGSPMSSSTAIKPQLNDNAVTYLYFAMR